MVVPIVQTTEKRKKRIWFLAGLLPVSLVFGKISIMLNLSNEVMMFVALTMFIMAALSLWGILGAKKFDKIGKMELSKSGVAVELKATSHKFNWEDLQEINFCFLNSPHPDHKFLSLMQIERCFLAFTTNDEKHFYYFAMPIQEMALCSENLAKHLQNLGLPNVRTFNLFGKSNIPEEVLDVKKKYLVG